MTLAQAVCKCAEEGWLGFKASYVRQANFTVYSADKTEMQTHKQAVRQSLRDINNTDW